MFKKLVFAFVFLMGMSAMSYASVGGVSKYAKLYVFDTRNYGPVTATTTHIFAYVDLIDIDDFKKSEGIPANTYLTFSIDYNGKTFYVNDLQNNSGTINQIDAGQFGAKGYTPGNFEGNTSVYLGEYSISPSSYPYFKGGAVIQFNIAALSNTGGSILAYINASQTVPFNQAYSD